MSRTPRLTIGLPVYNGQNYLTESLEAILGQTYEDFELLISDNASTDDTSEICRRFAKSDSRIRYIRQPYNIGLSPNHNFVIQEARGELFKSASHDDLYARDIVERCIHALDEHPEVVLAHSWTALIDEQGTVTSLPNYPVATDLTRPSDRFRSMLFDGWSDDEGGVTRMEVLRRVSPHASYHFADRTFTIEIALHGPFFIVPEWLHFRRRHSEQAGIKNSARARCVTMDPRRAGRLRNPSVRLYGEYLWGFVRAVQRAPLDPAERRACYGHLSQWASSRCLPVAVRGVLHRGIREDEPARMADPPFLIGEVVARPEAVTVKTASS